jgi:hypothetical protein
MKDAILLGFRRYMLPIPALLWQRLSRRDARGVKSRLRFMSADHHRVRNFVVEAIPDTGAPLPPELIADRLGLPVDRVVSILAELEENMTFVYRGDGNAVSWAYPVTADRTPHFVTCCDGSETHAA